LQACREKVHLDEANDSWLVVLPHWSIIIRVLTEDDRITGFGLPKVRITESRGQPATFETLNPIITATEGAGKVFILSYWAGALGALLGQEVVPTNIVYDPAKNTLSCSFIKKG